MSKHTHSIVAFFAVALTAVTAQSETLVNIDLAAGDYVITNAEATSNGDPRPHLQPVNYGPTTQKFVFTVDTGTQYGVGIEHTRDTTDPLVAPENRPAERVIAVDIKPRVDTNVKDKILLSLDDKNGNSELRVDIEASNTKRYLAFDIKFAQTFELPPEANFLILLQGVQLGMGTPPFSMRVVGATEANKQGPINLKFLRSVDSSPTSIEYPGVLGVPRDKWLRFVFQLIPAYEGKPGAQVAIWHWNLEDNGFDAEDTYVYKWTDPWGYQPSPGGSASMITYGLGIYRRSQERVQGIKLRNIRYGNNKADVMP